MGTLPAATDPGSTQDPAAGARASLRHARRRRPLHLAAIVIVHLLLLQALASAMALARGPEHRHVVLLWSAQGESHARAHAQGVPHHHADGVALEVDASAIGLDSAGLMLLIGLLALGTTCVVPLAAGRFACPAAPRAPRPRGVVQRPYRPPRA